MLVDIWFYSDTDTVHVSGRRSDISVNGQDFLEGWYSTPDEKVESTERQAGHGAHAVTADMVLYSARTVEVNLAALGNDRAATLAITERVQRMAGKVVRLRVSDGDRDTYATGYVTIEWEAERYPNAALGTVTFVAPDPRRYAWDAATAVLAPLSGTVGGIVFDKDGNLEVNPVTFFGDVTQSNAATVTNGGTSTAYPTIEVSGTWPNGLTLNHGGGQLSYGAAINWQTVVFDCLTRTASINGVDVTRNLVSRDFPSIKAGGTLRLSCMSGGNGAVTVTVRDTYI